MKGRRSLRTRLLPTRQSRATRSWGRGWRLVSIVDDDADEALSYSALISTFATDSKLTSLALYGDGRTETYTDTYRVVDDVTDYYHTEK